jgi:hypothetical protein
MYRKMSNDVNRLIDKAIYFKRDGNFEGAKNCYIEAIELDPYNMMTFIALGKTAHLTNNQGLAVRCYLASTHLQLSPIEKAIHENNLPIHLKFQYENISKELISSLPKKSAFTIYIDPNTPRHMAHSLIDLSEDTLSEYPQLVPYAAVYKAHILGNDTHDLTLQNLGLSTSNQIETDQDIYIPHGRDFLIKELKWEKISSNNVLDIYFE